MRRAGRDQTLGGILAAALAGVLVLATVDAVQAQQRISGTAEVRRVAGRVEVLRKGQAQWAPAVVGAKLAEGDDLRAYSASSAELFMADGSTLVLAENSRVFVTKLEFDAQNQTRLALFHLVVGKAKAVVAQAAITLVRARQSNFAISTPTAVAAARGTTFVVIFNPALLQAILAVLVEDPTKPPSIVSFTSLQDSSLSIVVASGLTSVLSPTGLAPPVPISTPGIETTNNPVPPGPAFFGPPNPVTVLQFQSLAGQTPPVFFTGGPLPTAPGNPNGSIGRDTVVNQQQQQQNSTNP